MGGCCLDSGHFNWNQSLMEMCAALSGFAIQQLDLTIQAERTDEISFDASLLQQLGSILGSSLTHLQVERGHICRDFWPAVWAHLPRLQRFSLGRYIDSDDICLDDLGAFCTHAARPLQLCLDVHLMERVGPVDRLQELGGIWGAPRVTVTYYEGAS
jgi:hypothetical protein